MARQTTAKRKPPATIPQKAACKDVITIDRSKQTGAMREVGGSMDDDFNQIMLGSVCGALYVPASASDEGKQKLRQAAVAAMCAFKPTDEIEGMIAAQAVAINASVLECLRRAMVPDQTVESRSYNLTAANKLSRSFAALIDTLGRYRGKGMQTVRVEHVTVEAGANAVIGNVEAGGRGLKTIEGQCHAKTADAPVAALRGQDPARDALPIWGNEERSMQDARRDKSRRTKRA